MCMQRGCGGRGSRKSRSEKELGNSAHKEHKDVSLHAFVLHPQLMALEFLSPITRECEVWAG